MKQIGYGSMRNVYLLPGNKVVKVAISEGGRKQIETEVSFNQEHPELPLAAIYAHAEDFSWLVMEVCSPVREEEVSRGLLDNLKSYIPEFLSLTIFIIIKNIVSS